MALKEWLAIVADRNLALEDKERLLLDYHVQHNHRVHTHLLAHGSLLGCAIKSRSLKKIATQGWLTAAVIPVHSRDGMMTIIRIAVRSFA